LRQSQRISPRYGQSPADTLPAGQGVDLLLELVPFSHGLLGLLLGRDRRDSGGDEDGAT